MLRPTRLYAAKTTRNAGRSRARYGHENPRLRPANPCRYTGGFRHSRCLNPVETAANPGHRVSVRRGRKSLVLGLLEPYPGYFLRRLRSERSQVRILPGALLNREWQWRIPPSCGIAATEGVVVLRSRRSPKGLNAKRRTAREGLRAPLGESYGLGRAGPVPHAGGGGKMPVLQKE
jgi:hypothetical protein